VCEGFARIYLSYFEEGLDARKWRACTFFLSTEKSETGGGDAYGAEATKLP